MPNEAAKMFARRIALAWIRSSTGKIDWLSLETLVRDILRASNAQLITDKHALLLIDETFAAYTRRGNELSPQSIEDLEKDEKISEILTKLI